MPEWWRDFFNQDYIDTYGAEDAKKTHAEVAGIVKLLGIPRSRKILDLCCGYGRHAIALAKKGYDVTGYDFSEAMLKKAARDSRTEKVKLRLVKGDMRRIPFESEFDAVINMFTAFGYFDSQSENQKVLDGVRAALKPRGTFLLDTINRERIMRVFLERSWENVGEDLFALDERSFDPLTSRISAKTIILGPRKKKDRHHSIRLYTLTELAGMIEKAGMKVRSVCGHMDGRDYWIDTPRMVILAEKNASRR